MKPPVKTVQEVLPLVPHRPPMVWIDEIVAVEADSGECRVRMSEDRHFWGRQGLRPSACLEFIAQAYGFCSVAYGLAQRPDKPPLKRAFLAAFKDVDFASDAAFDKVVSGEDLRVLIGGVRQIGPITMFSGRVLHKETELCHGQMKVFSE
ncbi:MAG: hypothetical protein AB7F86_18580 [Bdellovibrionales bacterium]